MVSTGELSSPGKSWLIESLDPYHDETVTLTGYPDNNVSSSVIQCIKKTMTFSAPAAVGSGNWDCNVVMFNNERASGGTMNPTNWQSTITGGAGANPALLSAAAQTIKNYPQVGVVAGCAVTGQPTFGSSNVTAVDYSNVIACADASNGDTYLTGNARVVAKGFEVVNTTKEIALQGAVLCWSQPTPTPDQKYSTAFTTATTFSDSKEKEKDAIPPKQRRHPMVPSDDEMDIEPPLPKKKKEAGPEALPTNVGWVSTYSVQAPPGTLEEAQLLPHSQQWEAKDGAYIVARFNQQENPAKQLQPMVTLSWEDSMTDGNNGLAIAYPNLGTVGTTTTILCPSTVSHVSPFDISGAYFSGLSPETTLTVNAVWYVERFPTIYEKDLVVMASPSPGFDPKALEIYQKALSRLPLGVKQGENPLGEWFNNVVKAVQDVAVPAGRMIGNFVPGVGAATELVDQIATQLRPIAKSAKKRERKHAAKAVGKLAAQPVTREKEPGPGSSMVKKSKS